tara:strand:- start:1001 stop:1906 length:906 start_codon:yes stop_codon:yes gene_type:complete
MAAFKTLNAQDIIVSPLHLNKGFRFEGQTALSGSDVNIGRYLGKNVDYLTDKTLTGPSNDRQAQSLVYNQTKQLYYTNYLSGSGELSNVSTASFNPDGTVTGRVYSPLYDNFLDTTLDAKRYFPTASNSTIGVLSIPQYMYGDYIQPESFNFITPSGNYIDDGEGRLVSGSTYIGNIIYEHGIIVLTGGERTRSGWDGEITTFVNNTNVTCSFSSSYTIYETQYKCTIGESEFNYSQNPSVISGSNGTPWGYATSASFAPYITTVGLYNNQNDLIAVGKLAQPTPVSKTTDTTILINVDRQ